MKLEKNKVALIILDGWGISPDKKISAIEHANIPFIKNLYNSYPHTALQASGEYVGLPKGQMGNSEVGHMTIGAGRVIDTDLVRINKSITSSQFFQHEKLKKIAEKIKFTKKNLHIIGLMSDGGIHSHIDHFFSLIKFLKLHNIKFFTHAITDGRDSSIDYLKKNFLEINKKIESYGGKLSTIIGRFFAMDRDKNWDRTNIAFESFINGNGEHCENFLEKINDFYEKKIYDEFLPPLISSENKNNINNGDTVIFLNYRTDRVKQLASKFIEKSSYDLYSFVDYGFENGIEKIFEREKIKNSLNEVLVKNNLEQLRIAETEKFAHVTYFFDCETQDERNERNILCNSPKQKTYDLVPEMAAHAISEKLLNAIEEKKYDFICINYANADMVGHTGNFSATVKACETIDEALKKIIPSLLEKNYTILLTADHGNADKMIGSTGKICTTHSLNLVPFILIDKYLNKEKINLNKNSTLADIAPTILKLLNIKKPKEMTGKSIF